MSKSGGETQKSVEPQVLQFHDNIRSLINLLETNAPAEQIEAMERQIAEQAGKDQFNIMRMLPHFVRAVTKTLTAAAVYEHFQLPGRDRVVHDRRGESEGKRSEAAAEAKPDLRAEMEIKEGKLVSSKEKTYENYLAGRMEKAAMPEPRAVQEKIERLLSTFERLILERFEEGRALAKESPDGKPKLLSKTEAEWKEFFNQFRDRIVGRKISFEEIGEFLFRGLVNKGNKGIVISDLTFKDGRVEKFIRFSALAEALAKLQNLKPGDVFGAESLPLLGEEFMYLALAASRGRDIATSPLPIAGRFVSGKTEELVARELGIPAGGQYAEGKGLGRMRGRRPLFGGLIEDREGPPEELPYQFIPWWHWGNLKRPGRMRWTTVAFYAALLAISLMGIAVLTYRLLKGG
jgi:hypothetical protein